MTDREELTELMQVIHDVHHGDCTNPDECIDGVYTDEETAMAILARWRLVPNPTGHVRESIDPRRDIAPNGFALCTKCKNPVAVYRISEAQAGVLTVTYEPLSRIGPCID